LPSHVTNAKEERSVQKLPLLAIGLTSLTCLLAACDSTSEADGAARGDSGAATENATEGTGDGLLFRPDVNRGLCLDAGGGVEGPQPYMRGCDDNNPNLHWQLTSRFGGILRPEVNAGVCVDANGGGVGPTVMRPCDGNNPNQRWFFRSDGLLSPEVNGGVCLDAGGGGEGVGAYLGPCDGNNPNQRWSFNTKWSFVIDSCSAAPPNGATKITDFPRCITAERGFLSSGIRCGSGLQSSIGNYLCTVE
jgi:hypothetical protein